MDTLTFILLLTIVAVASHFVNRYMNERKARYEALINSTATPVAPSAAFEEQLKKFDDRINATWEHISGVKLSVESLKLQIGLRNNK
jgi:phage terminase large subunit GpA-like protein